MCLTAAQKTQMLRPLRWNKPRRQRGEAPRCPRWILLLMHWQVQQHIKKGPPVVHIFQSSFIGKWEPCACDNSMWITGPGREWPERSFLPRWHSDAERNEARSPTLRLRSAARTQSGGKRAPRFCCSFVPLVSRLKWRTLLRAHKRRAHKRRKLLQVLRQRHYTYAIQIAGKWGSFPRVWHDWRKNKKNKPSRWLENSLVEGNARLPSE